MNECDLTEEMLINAWHSELRLGQLCTEFGLSDHKITKRWRQLQALGKLPKVKRKVKPNYMDTRNAPPYDDVDSMKRRYWDDQQACEELLRLLVEHHGPDGRSDIPAKLR